MSWNSAHLEGQTFGHLKVLGRASSGDGRVIWNCVCKCGAAKTAHTSHLRNGIVKSCGCLKHETTPNLQHGKHGSPTYRSWQAMKQRCKGRGNDGDTYVKNGITYCPAWESFAQFYADMGERPLGSSLDRYPNGAGNYEPGNCRWATSKQQSRNRKDNVILEWQGEKQTLQALAEIAGLSRCTLDRRLKRGWSLERAMHTPPDISRQSKEKRSVLMLGDKHILSSKRPEVRWGTQRGIRS